MELSSRNRDTTDLEESAPATLAVRDVPPVIAQKQLGLNLFAAAFSFFAAGANDGCLGSLIPYILSSYGTGMGSIAILYLSNFLGWFLAALSSTYTTHHLTLPALLILGAFLQLLSQILRASFLPPFGLFAFTFFLTGLGQALQDSHSNTFVSSVNQGGSAHRWLGLIHAMYGMGLLASPFAATALATRKVGIEGEKWREFFWVLFGIGVCNLILVGVAFWEDGAVLRKREVTGSGDGEGETITTPWQEMVSMLKLRNVWVISLFYFFYLGTSFTAGGWIVEFLVQARHGSLREVGYVPSGFYGGLFISRLLLAEPTHRFGERRMLLLYSVLCLVFQLVFWLVPNLVSGIAMFSILGFFLGPFFAAGMSVASKLFPSKIQPAALGMIFVVAQAGAAIFPSLIGLIASQAGVKVLPPIVAGLIVAMGLMWSLVPKIPEDDHVE